VVRVLLLPLIGISYLLVNGLWYLVPFIMGVLGLLLFTGSRQLRAYRQI